jgi:hypothetical protein
MIFLLERNPFQKDISSGTEIALMGGPSGYRAVH